MTEKLQDIIHRFDELNEELAQPDLMNDMARYQALMREHADLAPKAEAVRHFEALTKDRQEAETMLSDPDLMALAKEEIPRLDAELEKTEQDIRLMLLPRDPNDDKNVVVEIRGGAGGEEASLFAAMLLRMYTRYAERQGYQVEYLSITDTELDGIKEAVFLIKGLGAYSQLKFDSGVHRIQRVPSTESQGRIHTSTATVAVLPETDDVEIDINPQDLRIDVYRASGHGGQYINKTDSAVRITHLPTGLVVTCQNEKSQLKNKEQAMKVLRSRLHDKMQQEQHAVESEKRRAQVGTGDRSERIRTYNFPQGRVTDHRIGLTLYQIDQVFDGDLTPFIQALQMEEQLALLKENEG